MTIMFGNTTVTTVYEYTASVVRSKTDAAIEAAKVVSDDQLAAKYKQLFDRIDTVAENQLYTTDVWVTEVQRSEIVPLLQKLGFTVAEKPVSQVPSLGAISARAGSAGSLTNTLAGVSSSALYLTNAQSGYSNIYLTISWK